MPEISRKIMDRYAKVLQLFLRAKEEGERESARQRLVEMESKYPGVKAAVEEELEQEAARRKNHSSRPQGNEAERKSPSIASFFDDLLSTLAAQSGFSGVIDPMRQGDYVAALLQAAKAVNLGARKDQSEIDRILHTVTTNAHKGISVTIVPQDKELSLRVNIKRSYLTWVGNTMEKKPGLSEEIKGVFFACLQEAFAEMVDEAFNPPEDEDEDEDEDDYSEEEDE